MRALEILIRIVVVLAVIGALVVAYSIGFVHGSVNRARSTVYEPTALTSGSKCGADYGRFIVWWEARVEGTSLHCYAADGPIMVIP